MNDSSRRKHYCHYYYYYYSHYYYHYNKQAFTTSATTTGGGEPSWNRFPPSHRAACDWGTNNVDGFVIQPKTVQLLSQQQL